MLYIMLLKAHRQPHGHKEYIRHTRMGKIVHVPAKGRVGLEADRDHRTMRTLVYTLRRQTGDWTAKQHHHAVREHMYAETDAVTEKKTELADRHANLSDAHDHLAALKTRGEAKRRGYYVVTHKKAGMATRRGLKVQTYR